MIFLLFIFWKIEREKLKKKTLQQEAIDLELPKMILV